MNEQIALETQLNEAKLAKVQMESTIEKEILLKEKQAALEEVLATKKTLAEIEKREYLLKQQLSLYTSRYDEFQTSLQKSNDMFGTYKIELDRMAKKSKTLEKEAYEWRSKYEKSHRALMNLITDKQAQDDYVQRSARQLAQLQKLCRTLQAERGTLLDALKANNIERPAMPELPPEPTDIVAPPKPTDKLDVMSENCKELKETLANLQSQINSIRLDGSEGGAKGKTTESSSSKKPKVKSTKVKRAKAKSSEEPKLEQNGSDEVVLVDEPAADRNDESENNDIAVRNGENVNIDEILDPQLTDQKDEQTATVDVSSGADTESVGVV